MEEVKEEVKEEKKEEVYNPKTASVYERLWSARQMFHSNKFLKAGKVKFNSTNFSYFRLEEIIPLVESIAQSLRVIMPITFENNEAILTFMSIDNPTETIVFKTPTSLNAMKGGTVVQNIGAMQTYIRRYLYVLVFDIIEQETVDDPSKQPKPVYVNREEAGVLWNRIKQNGIEEGAKMVMAKYNMKTLGTLEKDQIENFYNDCLRASQEPMQ